MTGHGMDCQGLCDLDLFCSSLAVSRSKDVPPFGPLIPDGAMFPKSADFAEFLLTKGVCSTCLFWRDIFLVFTVFCWDDDSGWLALTAAINAENAAHKSDKFRAMATRTRQEYLKDLATNYVTTSVIDSGSKLSESHAALVLQTLENHRCCLCAPNFVTVHTCSTRATHLFLFVVNSSFGQFLSQSCVICQEVSVAKAEGRCANCLRDRKRKADG